MNRGFLFTLQGKTGNPMKSIDEIYQIYRNHPVVSTDSRKTEQNGLFFALKGDHFDGNLYAGSALEKGYAYAIVDDPGMKSEEKYILVEDVLKTLQELASHHRNHLSIPVIAVTGSNGKTTTKELIHAVLSKRYKTVATKSNLNNHIGVPLTLLSITEETEIAIIEMGANHPGEIGFLCELARPDFGIITNIGRAHLEGFGSFEGVIRAKTELYRWLRDNGGIAFINADNPILVDHSSGIKKFTYGEQAPSDYPVKLTDARSTLEFETGTAGKQIHVHSNLYGSYNFENLAAAASIGYYFNIGPEEIKSAIEEYIPTNNRSQLMDTGHNLLILDAYNANPTSMEAAIDNFSRTDYKNKIVILGDMLELGPDSEKEHLNIMRLLENTAFNAIYLVGPEFTKLCTKKEWTCFQDSELARLWFEHHKPEGMTILIKGSRGIRMEQIAEVL
jgi:UDP-N-acetylmuramoyl-tripeptide--D-alanyl-D-alanine ligase